jgi:hypothetical protein
MSRPFLGPRLMLPSTLAPTALGPSIKHDTKSTNLPRSDSTLIMSTPAMRAFLASERVNKKPTSVFRGYYRDKNANSSFMFCDNEMPLKGK